MTIVCIVAIHLDGNNPDCLLASGAQSMCNCEPTCCVLPLSLFRLPPPLWVNARTFSDCCLLSIVTFILPSPPVTRLLTLLTLRRSPPPPDAYVVVAFSWLAAAMVSIMQCTVSKILRCGMRGNWADVLLSLVLCIWWSVACGVISVGVGKASGQGLPQGNWRTATLVLFWIEFLVYLLLAISGAVRNAMVGMVSETVSAV